MDPAFVDDCQATQNNDRAIGHGRRAGTPVPWTAELVRARDRNDARRTPTHRKEKP